MAKGSPQLEKSEKSWLNFFIDRFRLTVLLAIGLSLAGLLSFFTLPRELQPEVEIPTAYVMAVYPGAPPEDTENLVTKELENKIEQLEGLDSYTSDTGTGYTRIRVEFNEGENISDVIQKLREKVDEARGSLPSEVEDPTVTEVSYSSIPILTLALSGPYSPAELREYAEKIKDEVETYPDVQDVFLTGAPEKRVQVVPDNVKLMGYGLTVYDLSNVIRREYANFPLGKTEMSNFEWSFRVEGRFETVEEIKNLPVKTLAQTGEVILLRDVAEVREGYEEMETYSRFSLGGEKPDTSVALTITKGTGGDILRMSDTIQREVRNLTKGFPADVELDVVQDYAEFINNDFETLIDSGSQTILLVFVVLLFFIGWKQAVFAAMTVPLAMFFGFLGMELFDFTLNGLSLFALILTLGILVDNGIIVQEGVHYYREKGVDPRLAAKLSVRDFKWPILTGTLTTISAFVPMLLTPGMVGEFIKVIPITVSVVLLGSLFTALVINTSLSAYFLERKFDFVKWGKKLMKPMMIWFGVMGLVGLVLAISSWGAFSGGGWQTWFSVVLILPGIWVGMLVLGGVVKLLNFLYERFNLSKVLHDNLGPIYRGKIGWLMKKRRRRVGVYGVVVIAFILAVSLPVTGLLQVEMFEGGDYDFFSIEVEGKPGQSLDETDKVIAEIEKKLLEVSELKNFVSYTGSMAGGQMSLNRREDAPYLGSISVNLVKAKERERTTAEVVEEMRGKTKYLEDKAKIVYFTEEGGPPTFPPIYVRIFGEDLDRMGEIVNYTKRELQKIPFVTDIDDNMEIGKGQYTFRFDRYKMAKLGVNQMAVSYTLRAMVDEIKVLEMWKDEEKQDLVISFMADEVKEGDLLALNFPTMSGEMVSLQSVLEGGRPEFGPEYTTISRDEGEREFVISAYTEEGHTAAEALAILEKRMQDYEWPEGYHYKFGGEAEDINESFTAMGRALIVALILIMMILVLQFNSFSQPFIIMLTIMFSFIGVFPGLTLLGFKLTFPAIIGIVALAGIVVNDAIVLVDRANSLVREHGCDVRQAALEAGYSRLQPVILTTFTTVAGVLPLAYAQPIWAPLSWSIACGLMVTTFLTLIYVPTLYVSFSKGRMDNPEKDKEIEEWLNRSCEIKPEGGEV